MTELPNLSEERIKKPSWLKVKLPVGENYRNLRNLVDQHKLHTICESGNCPNMGECWGAGTATFMILGNICTRSCSFCNVATGKNPEYDRSEPLRVADAIRLMNVKHAVITSVNRDELPDKGAWVWAETIRKTKELNPHTTMETLIPDFMGHWDLLYEVIDEKPEVVSHNMETVKRLYRTVRMQAKYERSLEQIQKTKERGLRTKSGVMLGLGETQEEVLEVMKDLSEHGCDVMTLGQYLQPTKMHHIVERFVTPDEFKFYETEGMKMGFDVVESGPLVRSSYHAEKHI